MEAPENCQCSVLPDSSASESSLFVAPVSAGQVPLEEGLRNRAVVRELYTAPYHPRPTFRGGELGGEIQSDATIVSASVETIPGRAADPRRAAGRRRHPYPYAARGGSFSGAVQVKSESRGRMRRRPSRISVESVQSSGRATSYSS